ncbi:MAG TPA: DUF262 domain-containing protein [Bacteroidia bacterium]|nr:DUF262 domain-containing protein [Bacteroidia bacterium]
MKQQSNIQELNIKELLSADCNYVIPAYQRNYAWGEKEIIQLIQDIIDYIPLKKNYYLGTLVVDEQEENGKKIFETIDGQQRLTTLTLLLSVLKNEYNTEVDIFWFTKLNLKFYSRTIATKSLDAVYKGHFNANQEYKETIKSAYELIIKNLPLKLKENEIHITHFSEYLFNFVKILRVPVPFDTDLNHYFEIMNNRGEQLEKHEIQKSKFLEILNTIENKAVSKKLSFTFNRIWEACSSMDKYVQYGFDTTERSKIFGDKNWNNYKPQKFEDISDALNYKDVINDDNNYDVNELSISQIISGKKIKAFHFENDDNPDRFNSVINFSNFLLHVLKLQVNKTISKDNDVALDDKRLLSIFEEQIKKITNKNDKIEFAKEFGFNLLRLKFMFDKFIIKREYIAGSDKWSLKRLKWYDGNKVSYINTFDNESTNRTTLMLLSMFHVSTPTLVYKHWLNASMKYLFEAETEVDVNYIEYLENLSKTFVFDRFLATTPKGYYQMIFENNANFKNTVEDLSFEKLIFHQIENNLVFNYLDYLLWLKEKENDAIVSGFEYTFRSSVEHYYPQNPMEGYEKLPDAILNSFGNLCLISHSKNSKLSNLMPTAKKEYYANNTIDSIKQYIMMKVETENWKEVSINTHYNEMEELLKQQIETII